MPFWTEFGLVDNLYGFDEDGMAADENDYVWPRGNFSVIFYLGTSSQPT